MVCLQVLPILNEKDYSPSLRKATKPEEFFKKLQMYENCFLHCRRSKGYGGELHPGQEPLEKPEKTFQDRG